MATLVEIAKPTLTFEMFQAGIRGADMALRAVKEFFGSENYDAYRSSNNDGEFISEDRRQAVDALVYDKIGLMYGVRDSERGKFWQRAMGLANDTVNYARGILFADQDRQATLVTNITWAEGRPSSALEVLTMPAREIGQQYRFEQGRQLGLALLCAELINGDENGDSKRLLTQINNFLEAKLFQGKRGDPKKYPTFSYHIPGTDKLVGFSLDHPDPSFSADLWVKSLEQPVRMVRIKDPSDRNVVIPTLYDPREKDTEATVIKALHRSLKAAKTQSNGGLIETFPYQGDRLGFRLVVMEEDRPLRDKLTADLEDLLWTFDGVCNIQEDDEIDTNNGHPNRIEFRRRQVHIAGLRSPLEVIVQTHGHYVSQLYEVGSFNPEIGMHDGPAHDLYKLMMVAAVAEYLWPPGVFGIDLEEAKKSASYEYATRLGRKQRISPSPYEGES